MIASVSDAATMPPSSFTERAHSLAEQRDHIRRPPHDSDPGLSEGRQLFFSSAGGPGDDGAGVTHPAPLGRGLARNKANNRLGDPLLHEGSRPLLVGAADLADDHDGVGIVVGLKSLETRDEVGANDRVAPDANAGTLADTVGGKLVDHFVGERAASGDQPHPPWSADVARNDSDFGLARGDQTGTVGANQPRS